MSLLTVSAILWLLGNHEAFGVNSDVGLTPPQMIENHGYPSETHYITTEDGYILTYFRIPHGINDNSTTKRPAVLLMHGIDSSSADFVAVGPGHSLSYILADAGYDVWLANARGNAFSRNHTTIDVNVDPEKFFNYTWHEIGYYDLANSIDYILDLKGDDNLYFVGHSQGTTTFLVLASTRPEYNSKIRIASLMAAAAIVKHYPNILIQSVVKHLDLVQILLERYKIFEMPFTKERRDFVSTLCADPSSDPLCDMLYNMKFSADPEQALDKEYLAVIDTNSPSNTGMKQYIHFAQQIRDGGFRYYDYGAEKNLEVYGSEVPPDYDLSKISTPVAIYYAKNDDKITVEDEETLIGMIPNVINQHLIPHDLFTHSDFLLAKDIGTLVYNELLEVMAKY